MTEDRHGPAGRALARVGWSEGDAWTVGVGLTVALALAVSTIPAVLEVRPTRQAVPVAAAPPPAAGPAAPLPPPVVVALPPAEPTLPLTFPPPVPPPFLPPPAAGPAPAPPPDRGEPAPRRAGPPVGVVTPFATLDVADAAGGLALGPDGSVLVGTDAPADSADGTGAPVLLRLGADGRELDRSPVPGAAQDRERGLTALAPAGRDAVLAVEASTSRLVRRGLTAGAAWTLVATVPDVAPCLVPGLDDCQPGLTDTAPLLRGLAVDADGTAYVADAGQGTIWRVPSDGAPEVWTQGEDLLGPEALAGLELDAADALLVVVTRVPGLTADGSGSLQRVERSADGTAGARTQVTGFAPGEEPVDVAISPVGLHVALRGADAVVLLDAGGEEQLRFDGGGLVAPSAIVVEPGRLLVAGGGDRPSVLQVGLSAGPR